MNSFDEMQVISMLKDPVLKDKGFILLMDAYKEPIYWYIRRMVKSHEDAEDILQETFINVYRFVDSFKGDSKIFTWLYSIATNQCTQHFRKNNKRMINEGNRIEENSIELSESESESGDIILLKFQNAISRLPEKQKFVFNLRYYDELSYEDIGQIMDSTVNSLKSNYHYACQKIKKYLIDNA